MPSEMYVIFGLLLMVIAIAVGLFTFSVVRQLRAERQELASSPGWAVSSTSELTLWRQEQDKERVRCPVDQGGCGGTRCWDFRRNNRPCGDNPTTTEPNATLAQGRHFVHTVIKAPAGWWPLPRSRAARVRHDLWRKVADHCQISLVRQPGVVLP